MPAIVITIHTDNAAFTCGDAPADCAVSRAARAHEIARILDGISFDLRTAYACRTALRDINGNVCGTTEWKA